MSNVFAYPETLHDSSILVPPAIHEAHIQFHLLAHKLFDEQFLKQFEADEFENHHGFDMGNDPRYPYQVWAYNFESRDETQHLRIVFSEAVKPVDVSILEGDDNTYLRKQCHFRFRSSEPAFDYYAQFEDVGNRVMRLEQGHARNDLGFFNFRLDESYPGRQLIAEDKSLFEMNELSKAMKLALSLIQNHGSKHQV